MRPRTLVLLAPLLVAACSGGVGDDAGPVRASASSSTASSTSGADDTADTTSTTASTTTTAGSRPASTSSSTTTTVRSPRKRLVYFGTRSPESQPLAVWSADLDGGDRHVIADAVPAEGNIYVEPEVSPDGTRLAYRHKGGRIHVRTLELGGADVAVSPQASFYPDWVDDSTVVFTDAQSDATWIAAADGSNARLLHPDRYECVTDDERVVVRGRAGYLAVDPDGAPTPMTEDEQKLHCAEHEPGGDHIAAPYHGGARHPGTTVLIARRDGSEERRLEPCPTYFGRNRPSWAAADVLYLECVERAIERTTVAGDPVEVLRFGEGFWQFLGVRTTS